VEVPACKHRARGDGRDLWERADGEDGRPHEPFLQASEYRALHAARPAYGPRPRLPLALRHDRPKPTMARNEGGSAMQRRTVLKGALLGAAGLAMPFVVRAQGARKLSFLTWNIADQEQLFKLEFADF